MCINVLSTNLAKLADNEQTTGDAVFNVPMEFIDASIVDDLSLQAGQELCLTLENSASSLQEANALPASLASLVPEPGASTHQVLRYN